ncbi:MAG TPA: VOC family protein, partial [Membranihabitans sp.]|nr:VOC family protein [Membranihabitans sp.]
KSTDPDGPVSKYLEKFGEGIHHIAFEVDDLEEEIIRLRDLGYRLIDETPQKGADDKWVVFLHPNSTNKVLIELCQEIGDDDAI